jgi:general secretion pathway protein A
MYMPFFGLRREPFSIAPDPRYLFMSERHREALAHLLYGVGGGGGFVLLTGQIGAGKTTVCRAFLDQVPETCRVAYVVNPRLSATELLQTVCDEFRIAYRPDHPMRPRTAKDYVDPLNDFLLQTHAAGHSALLVIDEAQQLSTRVLEQLRLLTNLETSERKLLQIVLIGQPELRQMLAHSQLEQLAQRVIARYHLEALDEADTARYVRHRLGVAGLMGSLPFDDAALREIHRLSQGIPRRINLLADRALLGAYGADASVVTRATVAHAATEVFGDERPASARRATARRQPAWVWTLAALAGLAALGTAAALGAWATTHWQRPPTVLAAAAPRLAPASQPPAASAKTATNAASQLPAALPPAPVPVPVPVPAPASLGWFNTEDSALQALAARWALSLDPAGDPCASALQAQARCWRSRLSLAELRRLDRPGVVTLQPEGAKPVHALLLGFKAERVLLGGPAGEQALPLARFNQQWRGGAFATLWRPPEGYNGRASEAPAPGLALWLARQLAQARAAQGAEPLPASASLRERVAAFQTQQGLPSDGVAGPLTLMLLQRANGSSEPRLSAPAQEAR